MPTKTVLVVDAHEDSRAVYAAILQFAGFSMLQARNAAEALTLVQQHSFSVVVTELFLPIVSGVELLRQLKTSPPTRDLPVIMVTTDARPKTREQALEDGCDRFLIKPCPPHDLLYAVQDVLGQRQPLEIHNG